MGDLLFKDGLFLTALVKLYTKNSKSPFLAQFLFDHISSAFEIEHNQYIYHESSNRAFLDFQKYQEEKYTNSYNKVRSEQNDSLEPVRRIVTAEQVELVEEKDYDQRLKARRENLALSSNHYGLNERLTRLKHKDTPLRPEMPNHFVSIDSTET